MASAEASVRSGQVTSIARLNPDSPDSRLVQVLDVEQILRDVLPDRQADVDPETVGPRLSLPPGSKIVAADDSALARSLIEQGLNALAAPVVMTRSGKEAWELLDRMATEAAAHGRTVQQDVALVLTDLEMPEMDGFTLTRKIKSDNRFKGIPVVIHSSLSGEASEEHVRKVGADAYVAKFVAAELAETIRSVLRK